MKIHRTLLICALFPVSAALMGEANGSLLQYDHLSVKTLVEKGASRSAVLQQFYGENSNALLWVNSQRTFADWDSLYSILNRCQEHGLQPTLFKANEGVVLLDSLRQNLFDKNTLPHALSRLELNATEAAVKYVSIMKFGCINPKRLLPEDYYITLLQPDSLYRSYIFRSLLASPLRMLAHVQPQQVDYLKLQSHLQTFLSRSDSLFRKIDEKQTIRLNDSNSQVPIIIDRLALLVDFKYTRPDSLRCILSPDILDAVNGFLKSNYYEPVTEITPATIKLLNKPYDFYTKKLKAGLERLRWRNSRTAHPSRVVVNVAAARLYAFDNNLPVLSMRTCVGQSDKRTPLLVSDINCINLNPQWHIPTSIIQKETYHSLKRNPQNYLQKRNMKMYKAGKEVDPTTIDWENTPPEKFFYSITQASGDGNSLGRMKFLFPNRFAVYLHDTPSKGAFANRIRAVSHGCVRLQQPVDFALYCTNHMNDSLYRDRILISTGRGPESVQGKQSFRNRELKILPDWINLEKTIQVCLDYHTAFTLPNDNLIYYCDDIYGYDNILLNAMR